MSKIKLENVKINVEPHSASKEYCILTLSTKIEGVDYKESISVYSKYIFDNFDETYVKNTIDNIVKKLTYDLLSNAYTDIDKQVKSQYNLLNIINDMKKYLN